MKRFSLPAGIFLLVLVVGGGVSLAASYPSKPVEFIAAASPGGGWDLTCRASAKVLQESKIVNVPITVFNKPGGTGAVVFNDIVRNRRADDYVLIAFSSVFTSQLALRNIKGTYKDITPIASMVVDYGVLAVKKDSPYKDLKSILSAMKKNPTAVSWAGKLRSRRPGSFQALPSGPGLRNPTQGRSFCYLPRGGGGFGSFAGRACGRLCGRCRRDCRSQ